MAGVCRAAFNTGAFVIDSGLGTNIEKFCLRKGVILIGVSPEAEVEYPRLNQANRTPIELTNGHTHFFCVGAAKGKQGEMKWGSESNLKFELAKRITVGRKVGYGVSQAPSCKMVTVIVGDNEVQALADIEASLNNKNPIVILSGSPLCNSINAQLSKRKENPKANDTFKIGDTKDKMIERLLKYSRVVMSSDNSEDIASVVHFLLTISI